MVIIKREAQRLERTVERLITDTDCFIHGSGQRGGGSASPGTQGEGEGSPNEPYLLETINVKMKAFRKELQAFLEQMTRIMDGLSPLSQLTESSSFLSTVTSVSRDSPIGTLGKELGPDLQVRGLPAWPSCSVSFLLLLAGIAALGLALLTAAWF